MKHLTLKDWYNQNGDKTLRLNYDLNTTSVVFDIGAYEGGWAQDIFCRYACQLFVFEPIKQYFNDIETTFKKNPHTYLYNFALLNKDESRKIFKNEDSSSFFKSSDKNEMVKCVSICSFLKEQKFKKIDLMKINAEGSEYDILECLIDNNLHSIIIDIQIQFHNYLPKCYYRRSKIQKLLTQTHQLTYNYPFLWENWHKK